MVYAVKVLQFPTFADSILVLETHLVFSSFLFGVNRKNYLTLFLKNNSVADFVLQQNYISQLLGLSGRL